MAAELQNKRYVLTLKTDIEAMDDAEARQKALSVLASCRWNQSEDDKLQEVFKDRAPRKVEL